MSAKIIGWVPEYSRSLHELLLVPGRMPRGVSSADIDSSTPLTKYREGEDPRLELKIPILSAAMQSVTGPEMAIAMAKVGGAGVIFCSQPIEEEVAMVSAVKTHKAGFVEPDVFSPEDLISDVQKRIDEKGYSTFPITMNGRPNGRLVGYLTRNDFNLQRHARLKVEDRMVPLEELFYTFEKNVRDEYGRLDLSKANEILIEGHHGSLPIVDEDMNLLYVVFRKDVREHLENPLEFVDKRKRLVCGAAINTHDYEERVPPLVEAEVDFLVIDTSQAYSEYVENCLLYLKENFPKTPVIAGNIVTKEGFEFLVENGADAVKVGMGSGYICITQEQIKVGRGQTNAVYEVAQARDKMYERTGIYIPIISDGGVLTASDITVALALGADCVMVGGYIVGTDESNSKTLIRRRIIDGRPVEERVKEYWGEGSARARQWAGKRYGHTSFEEGIVTEVPYVGSLKIYLQQPLAMIRDGIRKAGCKNIKELHANAVLEVISPTKLSMSGKKSSALSPLQGTR